MRPAVPPFFSPEGERSKRCNGRYPVGATPRARGLHPDGSAPSSVRACRRSLTLTGSLWAAFEPTGALLRQYRAGVYRAHKCGVKPKERMKGRTHWTNRSP